ncbi:MAG: hypothetical protein COZ46_02615 [Verrucomicrobia bacterium CG_4_10_14_3_um_filter_43_23]|nr:MAG: hypothetical protein AUJ82_06160 [Verrucomicrobia bacterium CG1_02_43_26]PIP60079.1 MAG: hypothetical protein COX01_00535 [Verrucomicrobia bacterium CG22_combo_CG10-13_8_21_14_all_43_17]PIX58674.1 MAG: hypothetical protein COZ46_02615 [Verrucomicrobia bacterium CG_4_10_14_3_um_filter_43_23]PIY62623.1 MAG: hypothetical protein COY94_01400 [Verrucomicrobia bacterium CG_4_10_14_0_8_um_filter_43_34]PJA43304.1 MAG: hypothetical protein CO175_08780 [Verrucomicrobia bacterium CG_4_9_14_3_um_fi
MNPLLITGLFSLGKALVNNLSAPKAPEVTPKESFEQAMKVRNSGKLPNELSTYLMENNVSNVDDINNLKKNLSNELINHPDVQAMISGTGASSAVTLEYRDGYYMLRSEDGKVTTLPMGSDAIKLAKRVQQLNQLGTASGAEEGMPLYDLSEKVGSQKPVNSNWLIRDTAGMIV